MPDVIITQHLEEKKMCLEKTLQELNKLYLPPAIVSIPFRLLARAGLLSEDSFPALPSVKEVETVYLNPELLSSGDERIEVIKSIASQFNIDLTRKRRIVWASSKVHCHWCNKNTAKSVIVCRVVDRIYPLWCSHHQYVACSYCGYVANYGTECFKDTCPRRYLDPDPPESFWQTTNTKSRRRDK
jgi:hypothetical protein